MIEKYRMYHQNFICLMKKNRRKSKYNNFKDSLENQKQSFSRECDKGSDKQNQARMMLLDMENDDLFIRESVFGMSLLIKIGICRNNKINLLAKMKAQEEIQASEELRKNKSMRDQKVLCPIDKNAKLDLDNFLHEKKPRTASKKHRFSLRNCGITFKSSSNLMEKGLQVKDGYKTISNLKRLLMNLQGPYKAKNQADRVQGIADQQYISKRKLLRSNNRVTSQYCSRFGSKPLPPNQKSQHQDRTTTFNRNCQSLNNYEYRSTSDASHQNRRSSVGFYPTSSPAATPLINRVQQSKLKNKCLFFKRNSVTTGQLLKKNRYPIGGFRKSTARVSHQTIHQKNMHLKQKNQLGSILINQERLKEQRKSRNLRNILFD